MLRFGQGKERGVRNWIIKSKPAMAALAVVSISGMTGCISAQAVLDDLSGRGEYENLSLPASFAKASMLANSAFDQYVGALNEIGPVLEEGGLKNQETERFVRRMNEAKANYSGTARIKAVNVAYSDESFAIGARQYTEALKNIKYHQLSDTYRRKVDNAQKLVSLAEVENTKVLMGITRISLAISEDPDLFLETVMANTATQAIYREYAPTDMLTIETVIGAVASLGKFASNLGHAGKISNSLKAAHDFSEADQAVAAAARENEEEISNTLDEKGFADEEEKKGASSGGGFFANLETSPPSGAAQKSSPSLILLDLGRAEHAKQVQLKLKKDGYYRSDINGNFDDGTKQALRAFKKANGLGDNDTWDALTQIVLLGN